MLVPLSLLFEPFLLRLLSGLLFLCHQFQILLQEPLILEILTGLLGFMPSRPIHIANCVAFVKIVLLLLLPHFLLLIPPIDEIKVHTVHTVLQWLQLLNSPAKGLC